MMRSLQNCGFEKDFSILINQKVEEFLRVGNDYRASPSNVVHLFLFLGGLRSESAEELINQQTFKNTVFAFNLHRMSLNHVINKHLCFRSLV
jgi:hypothetical protein